MFGCICSLLITEAQDRTLKLNGYTTNPTLQDYVIVWQDQPRIDHYTRGANSAWLLTRAEDMSASVDVPSVGVALPLNGPIVMYHSVMNCDQKGT